MICTKDMTSTSFGLFIVGVEIHITTSAMELRDCAKNLGSDQAKRKNWAEDGENIERKEQHLVTVDIILLSLFVFMRTTAENCDGPEMSLESKDSHVMESAPW